MMNKQSLLFEYHDQTNSNDSRTLTIFRFHYCVCMYGWLLLLFVPTWKYTEMSIHGCTCISSLLFVYALQSSPKNNADDGPWSLKSVLKLFRHSPDRTLLGIWIQFLSFDLLVAHYQIQDAHSLQIPQWQLIPILFLMCFYGPIGFLVYFVLRNSYVYL